MRRDGVHVEKAQDVRDVRMRSEEAHEGREIQSVDECAEIGRVRCVVFGAGDKEHRLVAHAHGRERFDQNFIAFDRLDIADRPDHARITGESELARESDRSFGRGSHAAEIDAVVHEDHPARRAPTSPDELLPKPLGDDHHSISPPADEPIGESALPRFHRIAAMDRTDQRAPREGRDDRCVEVIAE